MPLQNLAGWPFRCPYRNVGFLEYIPTQDNQLCKVTGKIRLAFHFVERNKNSSGLRFCHGFPGTSQIRKTQRMKHNKIQNAKFNNLFI